MQNEMDSQTGKIKDARLHLSETFLPSHRLAEININVLLFFDSVKKNVLLIQVD
jgi:hypothetical protein